MKLTIELTDEAVKEVLNELFISFSKNINLPIADTLPRRVLCISLPISLDDNVRGSLLMAEDTIKAYVRSNLVPAAAYLTRKEIWPGQIFILLCL